MAVPVLRLYDGFADTSPQLHDEVRELQARLRQTDRGIVVDGLFGSGTEQAVRDFQLSRGLRADGVAFDRDQDLEALIRADIAARGALHCVLLDEAQFLSRSQVGQLSEVVDALRIPVLCYGLRTDFRGELFEGSQYLLAWADELQEIKTICHSGKKATMNVRVDADGRAVQDGPQVEIGGNERYVSVSRPEFKKVMRGEGAIEPLQVPLL